MAGGVAPLLNDENARRSIGFDGLGDGMLPASVPPDAERSVSDDRDRDFGLGTVADASVVSSSALRMSISVPSLLTSFVFPCSISDATVSMSVGVDDRLTEPCRPGVGSPTDFTVAESGRGRAGSRMEAANLAMDRKATVAASRNGND